MARAASPLRELTTAEYAKVMGVGWATADKAKAYIEGVVERLGLATEEQVLARAAAVRDVCFAEAITRRALDKSTTYQLVGAAEAADRIYRLASGKATSHVHHLHELASREQLARRLLGLGWLQQPQDVVGTQSGGDGYEDGHK